MATTQYDKLWNSVFIKLCIIELCFQLGTQTVQPIASNAALALGASVTLAGILAGMSSAVSLALRFVSGRIVSRFPLNRMLIAAVVILGISSLSFAIFNSIPVLGASRVLYGMALVIKSVLNVAICARIVPRESMGQGVAWLGMANILCSALGPNLAQLIGVNFGYNMSYTFSATMFIVATLLAVTFPYLPQENAQKDEKSSAKDAAKGNEAADKPEDEKSDVIAAAQQEKDTEIAEQPAPPKSGVAAFFERFIYFDAIPLAFLGLAEGVMFGIVNMLTLTVSEMRGLPEMSVYFAVYVVCSFTMRPIVSKMYDKYGFSKVGPVLCGLMGLAMVTFAFTDNLFWIVLDGICFGIGQGCLWPCLQAECVRNVPTGKTSMSTNTFLLGVDIGTTSGPMIGGAILDAAGPTAMYLAAAVIGLGLVLYTFPYNRMMARRDAEHAAATENAEN